MRHSTAIRFWRPDRTCFSSSSACPAMPPCSRIAHPMKSWMVSSDERSSARTISVRDASISVPYTAARTSGTESPSSTALAGSMFTSLVTARSEMRWTQPCVLTPTSRSAMAARSRTTLSRSESSFTRAGTHPAATHCTRHSATSSSSRHATSVRCRMMRSGSCSCRTTASGGGEGSGLRQPPGAGARGEGGGVGPPPAACRTLTLGVGELLEAAGDGGLGQRLGRGLGAEPGDVRRGVAVQRGGPLVLHAGGDLPRGGPQASRVPL